MTRCHFNNRKETKTVTNNLGDLNNVLFDQLKRLNDDSLDKEKLEEEVQRTRAITDVSKQVIDTGKLVLEAEKYRDDKWDADAEVPKMLSDGDE